MATVTSNLDAVSRALRGLGGALNLRNRYGRGRIGDALIDTAAAAIVLRSVELQKDPGGSRWPKLRPRTVARKARLGKDPRINIEDFVMLSDAQVRGKTSVAADRATMQAGLDEETQVKVEAAEEGGPNRPKRPFYDLGRDGQEAVDDLFEGGVIPAAIAAAEGA